MYTKLLAVAAFACAATFTVQAAEPTPAKKEIIARILKLQQPGIEAMARGLAEQPASVVVNGMAASLPPTIDAKRRDGMIRDVQAEVRKYTDEAVPIVRDRALKLAPAVIGTLLDEKFTEEELRQLVAMIESPVYSKFQQQGNEMQRAMTQRLVAETRTLVEPKVKALEDALARKLGLTPVPAASASAPRVK